MFSQSTCFRRFEWPKGEINIEYVYALKCIWKTLNSSSCCCYCIQLSFAPITCQLSLWNVQKPHIDALGWCYDVGCSFLFKNHAKIRCQWCWCRRRDVSRLPHSKHWLLARRILCVCISVCVRMSMFVYAPVYHIVYMQLVWQYVSAFFRSSIFIFAYYVFIIRQK